MAGFISLRDALHLLDGVDANGQPERFSLGFVKKSTGEIVRIEKAYKPTAKHNVSTELVPVGSRPNSRKPHHWKNMTRNVAIDGTDQIRKFHIRLLVEFNGKKVYF